MRRAIQWLGLFAGPVLGVACYYALPTEYRDPDGQMTSFSAGGRVTMAVMVWMAIWWLTETLDISVTALLPVILFPVLGAADMTAAAAPYAHPLIFLFMGGFMIALSMRRWGLDKRIALMTLRLVGTNPINMVGGFMVATAVLSAFVSNTATTAMMLPIAVSVIDLLRMGGRPGDGSSNETTVGHASTDLGANFAIALMLGIAYSASIGGVATIIGTPPNAFLVAFVQDTIAQPYRMEISFARWLLIGLPLSLVFLPIAWLLITRVIYPIRIRQIAGGQQLILDELRALGRPGTGEWATFIVFSCVAICWMTRPLLAGWDLGPLLRQVGLLQEDSAWLAFSGLTDGGVAMFGALVLFVIPVDVGRREFAMNWETARQLPWGLLVLFGGGLSLAAAVKSNGVAEFIGSQAQYFAGMSPLLVVLLVTLIVILLTELTSNLATTATIVPVLAALAPVLEVHAFLLIIPATLAASYAFMLPVATPPNAIVFGSGEVTIPQMLKAGIWLNVIGVALVCLTSWFIVGPALNVDLHKPQNAASTSQDEPEEDESAEDESSRGAE